MSATFCRVTFRDAEFNGIPVKTLAVSGFIEKIVPEVREIFRPAEPDEPDTNIEVGYSRNALERHTLIYRDCKVKLTEKPYILFRYIYDLHRAGIQTEFDFAELSAVLADGDELRMSSRAIESLIHRVNSFLLEILSPIKIAYQKEVAYIHTQK